MKNVALKEISVNIFRKCYLKNLQQKDLSLLSVLDSEHGTSASSHPPVAPLLSEFESAENLLDSVGVQTSTWFIE